MLHGRDLILATKPFATEIRWKSWFYTLSTLVVLLLSFAVAGFAPFLWVRILSSVFAGLVLVRFFVIYHDHQHHAILNKSWLADVIFWLFGLFILAPTSIWKRSHDYHHAHNSKLFSASIGSYPIMTVEKFKKSSSGDRFAYLAARHPVTILFGYLSMFVLGMCIMSFTTSMRKHWDSLLALVLHVAGSVALIYFGGWMLWLTLILIPFFVSEMLGAYLFYAQHNFPGVTFKNNTDWTYAGAALDSSSFMRMNFFWRWVTANIGYHHIHHMNARIPFYRLPEVMEAIPELRNAKETTLNLRDVMACLRLKVWDPESQRMLKLSEIR